MQFIAKRALELHPTPIGLQVGKHDRSVQIWEFHSIPRKKIVLEFDPHCSTPHSRGEGCQTLFFSAGPDMSCIIHKKLQTSCIMTSFGFS